MTKINSSAVVIIPPKEIWVPIQEIRRIYDRQIRRWMPHITLLYPFRLESEYNSLESLFSTICEKIKSFEITFSKFKYFNHGKQKYTLWLAPEPESLIIDLQYKLLALVPDCNNVNLHKNGFTPHLSVGQIEGKKKLIEVIETLQRNWSQLKFTINSIYFIAREKQKLSKFEVKKTFLLN
jgi:2'-5' RNA ligase